MAVQPSTYIWILSRIEPPGGRLLLVAAFSDGSGVMRPAFLTPDGQIVPDSTAYAVKDPHQIEEFLSSVSSSLKLDTHYLLAGPYVVEGDSLHPDQLPSALSMVLHRAAVDQGAHARLNPEGLYEAVTPRERLVWMGSPSTKPGCVDVELYQGPPDPGSPPQLVVRESQLPADQAEWILLMLEHLRLFAYLETWRPFGHHALEGPLGPLMRIS